MDEELQISVNRELCFSESTEQLSHLLANDFSTEEEKNKAEYIYIKERDLNECRRADAELISIKRLKELIQSVEESGATHVAIDYHCDHGEYDIYGFKLARTSEQELIIDEELKELELKKDKEIKALETKLKKN